MKKILIISTLVILFFSCDKTPTEQGLPWMSIQNISNDWGKNDKNGVFIYYCDSVSKDCAQMNKHVFTNPTIIKLLNHYFNCTMCSASSKEDKTLMSKIIGKVGHSLSEISMPSFVLISPDLKKTVVLKGFKSGKELESVIVWVGAKYYEQYSYSTFETIYETNVRQQILDQIDGYSQQALDDAKNTKPSFKTDEEKRQDQEYQRTKDEIDSRHEKFESADKSNMYYGVKDDKKDETNEKNDEGSYYNYYE
jgi:hypothetical protein